MSDNIRAVLFDLDGTLIDSAPDIAAAVNELLATENFTPLPLADARDMIGNGVTVLVQKAFAARGVTLEGASLEAMHQRMMPIYARHLTNLTTLMPGAAETVRRLAGERKKVGVVTNKPGAFTEEILAHYDLAKHIGIVLGGDCGLPRKPNPDMLLSALDTLGATPADSVMIGDSPADAQSAHAAKMRCILVRGGYTTEPLETLGAWRVVDTMNDIGV